MKQLKNLAKQTAIYGLGSMLPRFLNYLMAAYYTRIFSREVYGVVTEFYAYVTFLIIILTYGMETAYFRFASNNKQYDSNTVYSTSLLSLIATSGLFVFLMSVFSTDIASSIGYSEHHEYIIWFAWILAFDALTAIPFARLRIDNRPIKFATFRVFNVLVTIFFNIFFLSICPYIAKHYPSIPIGYIFNPQIGVGYVFVSNLLGSMLTFFVLSFDNFKTRFRFDTGLWKEMMVYALPLLFAGLAGTVNETLDRVLLKYLTPEGVNEMAQLGVYGANVKLAVLMTLFIQMFRFAAEPFFFNYSKEQDSKNVFALVTKYFLVFCLIIFLFVTLYLDVLKYFLGKDFWEGLHIVPVLLMANLLLGLFFNLSFWYKLTNKTIIGFYLTLIGAIVTIVFNVLFIPTFGYTACAYAHLTCYSIMCIISYFWGQKHYPVKYEFKRIATYFLLAMAFFIISVFVKTPYLYLNMTISTLLLAIFVLFVIRKENLMHIILRKK